MTDQVTKYFSTRDEAQAYVKEHSLQNWTVTTQTSSTSERTYELKFDTAEPLGYTLYGVKRAQVEPNNEE